METDATLAVLLRTWRERALLTQEQLARKASLNVRTIRRMESGRLRRPRSESVRLLSDALRLSEAERTQLVLTARAPDPTGTPRQLPPDIAGFTGRQAQLSRLDSLLVGDGSPPTAVVIAAICGTAGVGKTALAVHWAHTVADRFPAGQLYVNLRGFAPSCAPTEPAVAIRGFLDALGVPSHRIPADIDTQTALYRSLLAGRRVLIVLDNARDSLQVRPLLPGTPPCLVIVTSRDPLAGLVANEGAGSLTLSLMSTVEAHDLLVGRLGTDRVTADPQAVDEIITGCARLPLALAVAAARAAIHVHQPLTTLAAELCDIRSRLDTLAIGEQASDVRAVFSWSYERLCAQAARLFRLLGLHPGPDIGVPAAASMAGIPAKDTRPLLFELTRSHLIAEQMPGRFHLHDLLRAYAAELNPEGERRVALHRMLDHYLHTGQRAARLTEPSYEPIDLGTPRHGTAGEDLADHARALTWFADESSVLVAAVQQAADAGLDTHAWQLAWTVATFFQKRGRWRDWAIAQRVALAAAERLGHRHMQASIHVSLAGAYTALARHDDGRRHLGWALDLYREIDDPVGQARVYTNLAKMCDLRGAHEEALRHTRRALALAQATNHQLGQAINLNALGWHLACVGEHRQALTHCERALAMHRALGNDGGTANALDSIGYAYHHLGDYEQAVDCYQQAIEVWRTRGDLVNQADALTHLGETYDAAGKPDAALEARQRALEILDKVDHPHADMAIATLMRVIARG